MCIEVTNNDNNEPIFIGLADDFLESYNYDSELEEILSNLDNYRAGYISNFDDYIIEKIYSE